MKNNFAQRFMNRHVRRDKDDTSGQATAEDGEDGSGTEATATADADGGAEGTASDPSEFADKFADQFVDSVKEAIKQGGGNSTEALELLHERNQQLREQLSALRDRVPADGAVVLTGAEAEAWREIQGVGDPETIKQTVQRAEEIEQREAELDRRENIEKAADAVGYSREALRNVVDDEKIEVDEGENDNPEAYVVVDGEDGEPVRKPLDEYAKENWGWALNSLAQQSTTRSFPSQQSGNGSTNENRASRRITRKYTPKERR